ncbi:MAG: alkaline phosphatase [Planctomycetaceae bacterium]
MTRPESTSDRGTFWSLGCAIIAVCLASIAVRLPPTPPRTGVTVHDSLRSIQSVAMRFNYSPVAHWGTDPLSYTQWSTHTNRLIPVYTFGTRSAGSGIDLSSFSGVHSVFRNRDALRKLYGRVPQTTHNPSADYLDQTDLAHLQRNALAAGKKHIFLVVFDGMDWETTRAAAIYNSGRIYHSGRGSGLHFQDYDADHTTQYGFTVTSPHHGGPCGDVDTQLLRIGGGRHFGGYDATQGGSTPWSLAIQPHYLTGKTTPDAGREHVYPDSAATATALVTGIKTYNGAINVDTTGAQLETVAHAAQGIGMSVGAVTSVPLSHATPAAAYAHNVSRNDYQDLTRDLTGLASVSHTEFPLSGLDVLLGGGYGDTSEMSTRQGQNFVPGNIFITEHDISQLDSAQNPLGKYVVARRTPGRSGMQVLTAATRSAVMDRKRLLGIFGIGRYRGHLPYQTADGDFQPVAGRSHAETYADSELMENPTLAALTSAAIDVLSQNERGFWLLVESGDVDWANHDNNLDNSIGAVLSGDAAVRRITDWVDQHSDWNESLLIVTADHGHYLILDQPSQLIRSSTRR